MAAGVGFSNYNAQRPSPNPNMIGQSLMQQQAPASEMGMEPMMVDERMDAPMPSAPVQPMMAQAMDAADRPFDPSQEHSPLSTQVALEDAIRRALMPNKAQNPQLRSPYTNFQRKQLGMPDAESALMDGGGV